MLNKEELWKRMHEPALKLCENCVYGPRVSFCQSWKQTCAVSPDQPNFRADWKWNRSHNTPMYDRWRKRKDLEEQNGQVSVY